MPRAGDAGDLGRLASVEKAADANPQRFDGVGCPRLGELGRDPLGQLLLEVLIDREEKRPLVLEVVVERSAGHLRPSHDLFGADVVVAALGEQLAAGAHQLGAGRLGSLGLFCLSLPPQ